MDHVHGQHRAHVEPRAVGAGHGGQRGGHGGDHGEMVADFRRRFWVSVVLTVPLIALAPMIQRMVGPGDALRFRGDLLLQLALASVVYFYGGWPFLRGLVADLRKRRPGMMTLVAVAVSSAYLYSAAVALGLRGEVFFWELVTLIDVMLLGHWIEMRSVMGASSALESLVALMPSEAHRLLPEGRLEEVPVGALRPGDRVLVKPGEKVPIDGTVVEGRSSVNQSMLTGESQPVERAAGQHRRHSPRGGRARRCWLRALAGRRCGLHGGLHGDRRRQRSPAPLPARGARPCGAPRGLQTDRGWEQPGRRPCRVTLPPCDAAVSPRRAFLPP